MRYQSTTGLDHDRIRELVTRIAQVLEPTQRRTGRPPTLDLHRSVLLTLLLLRQNLSQTVAADLLGISQPTVSRIFRRIAPLIGQVLCLHTPPLPEALKGRVVLVDGALIPTDDHATHRKANFNAKHRRPGMTVQALATLDGTLLAVSDPVEGRTHDKTAYTLTGLAELLADNEVVADLGYQGTPTIRPPPQTPRPQSPHARRQDLQHQRQPDQMGRRTRHRPPEELEDPRHRLPRTPERAAHHHPHRGLPGVLPPRLVTNF